ncbi:MAG: associated Golgi family protein [Candidatus Saccharibacteria bacterium]|nr:associated Golgi family protein [Candidatus Saccharibacteria bacterium]
MGYHFGHRYGKRLFRKKDSILFKQDYLEQAEKFYESHGGKTILLSRFVPVVRTFAPVVAGIGNMDKKKFFVYNVAGGTIWCTSVTLLGYWLGNRIPNIDHYIIPVVVAAMAITFTPTLIHIVKSVIQGRRRQKLAQKEDL